MDTTPAIRRVRALAPVIEAVLFGVLYLWLACHTSVGECPDEATRLQIPFWIFDYGTLPIGTEPLLRISFYGFSYGTSAYGPSVVAGLLMRLVGMFTQEMGALIVAARIPSVIAGVGTVLACNGIGRRLFGSVTAGLALGGLVGGLPQVAFLCAYHNNDAPSLCAAAIIVYAWLLGRDENWSYRANVVLGVAIGVCALTYYFAFGFILVSVPLYFIMQGRRVRDGECSVGHMWRGASAVTAVAILVGGWFYARMGVVLHGDIFGRATAEAMRQAYAAPDALARSGKLMYESSSSPFLDMLFDFSHIAGISWVRQTALSFVGKFGFLVYELPEWCYVAYGVLLAPAAIGLVSGLRNKEKRGLALAVVLAAIPAIVISAVYSYTSDYQAQGRYVIVVAIPLAIAIVAGVRVIGAFFAGLFGRAEAASVGAAIMCALVLVVCLALLAVAIVDVYVPEQFNGLLTGYSYWWPYMR